MTIKANDQIRLLDLDMLDTRELERQLPAGSCQIEREKVEGGTHGDLGLAAVAAVIVSPAALHAITLWLLKKRQRQSVTLKIEKIGPDGVIERSTLEFKSSSTEAPAADVAKQIVSSMKLDPKLLDALASLAT
jgi:hypothetical protein